MTYTDFTIQILLKWINKRSSTLVTLDLYAQITTAGTKTYLSHKLPIRISKKHTRIHNASRSQQNVLAH